MPCLTAAAGFGLAGAGLLFSTGPRILIGCLLAPSAAFSVLALVAAGHPRGLDAVLEGLQRRERTLCDACAVACAAAVVPLGALWFPAPLAAWVLVGFSWRALRPRAGFALQLCPLLADIGEAQDRLLAALEGRESEKIGQSR